MAKGTGHSFGCSTANSAIFGYCWICFLLDMIDMIDMIEFYLILLDIIGYYWLISLDITGYILLLLLDTCCQFKFRLSWASPSKLHYTSLPFRIEHPEHPKSWLGKKWPDVYSESQNNVRNRCVVYSGFYVYDAFRGVCLHACGDPQCEAVLHIKWGQWKAVYEMIPLNSRFLLHLTSATSYSNHTVIIINYSDEWWS